MADSILNSVKKTLGLDPSYTAFDMDVIMHINSTLSTLETMGVGKEGGFFIEDDTATWEQFIGTDPRLNSVKTYIQLRVRLVFDPPATSFALAAFEKQIEEIGWRLTMVGDLDRNSVVIEEPVEVIDGGAP